LLSDGGEELSGEIANLLDVGEDGADLLVVEHSLGFRGQEIVLLPFNRARESTT
jgi:hypothetical protein